MRHLLPAARLFALLALLAVALTGCGSGVSALSPGTLTSDTGSISFAATNVGSPSATQTITLTGQVAALTITAVNSSGTNASSFSVATTCFGNLDPNKTCTVTVGFTPASAGALSASLVVTSESIGSPLAIPLSGTGVALAPRAVFSATTVNFGNQILGANATSQTVSLRNSGTAPLSLASVALNTAGGQYRVGGTCVAGGNVAMGSSCTLVVTFAPLSLGTANGTLTVTTNSTGSPQVIALAGSVFNGIPLLVHVLAGNEPVTGASVQLYATGSSGTGSASVPLFGNAGVTDATGLALFPGQFSCGSVGTQVYLLSSGGSVAGGAQNPALTLAGALGRCNLISPGQVAVVDEATTVAAAYSLAPFYRSATAIGSPSSNVAGIANASLNAAEIADPATGAVPGTSLPANVTLPSNRVNSLANLVNACATTPATCAALFAAATPPTGTAPASTFDALSDIALNPGANVAALFALSQASSAYTPLLQTPPSDWTLYFTIAGGGMNSPSGLGLDSAGNLWVANYFNVASKFSTTGAAVFPKGITGYGLDNSYGLAVDLADNAWIPNEQPPLGAGRIGSVTVLTPTGTALSGSSGYTDGGLNYPIAIAIDPNGTSWVVDYGNSHLTLLDAQGRALSGSSGYSSASFAFPVAVAVDGNHFGWIANQSASTVTKVAPDGSSFTDFNCCSGASGIAVDQANNIWVTNFYGDSVSLIASNGTVVSKGYSSATSILRPQGIAIDGGGTAWVANYRLPNLAKLAGASTQSPGTVLSPANGLGADAKLLGAYAIAVDASGSIWVSNQGSDTVTKFIGLATPVKTPLSGTVKTP